MTDILTEEFTLAEVLSVISGYLLADFDRIHHLIEWMTGGPVFSHQLPSVAPYVVKGLVKQFPDFDLANNPSLASDIEILVGAFKSGDNTAAAGLLRELQTRWANSFRVAPLQPFDEFEEPPLITDNIKDKVVIIGMDADDFPRSI